MNPKILLLICTIFVGGCKTTKPLRPTVSINPHEVINSPYILKLILWAYDGPMKENWGL